MKITEAIATHILEVHEGNNWTEVNIKTTLEDVTHKEATTVTKASYNTIAALVHHLSFYNDVVMQRLVGVNPVISDTNGFEMLPVKNEHDWKKLKERNLDSARQLAQAVKHFPEEKIFQLTVTGHSTHYKMLHGIVEHAYYHLGQIVLLKKLVKQDDAKIKNRNSL